jgi:hypothetical protein
MMNSTHCPISDQSPLPNQQHFLLSLFERLMKAGRKGLKTLSHQPELQVWQKRDRQGGLHWYAYNPMTGRSFSASSEAEMRIWIEKQYLY